MADFEEWIKEQFPYEDRRDQGGSLEVVLNYENGDYFDRVSKFPAATLKDIFGDAVREAVDVESVNYSNVEEEIENYDAANVEAIKELLDEIDRKTDIFC